MKVELKPHIGIEERVVGGATIKREVHFHQCYVLVEGKQVGWYCGDADQPGKYLSLIEWQPPDVVEMIAAEVAKITGGVGKTGTVPKPQHDA